MQAGDRVLYGGEPSQIQFVAEADDPDTAWYVEQFGGGCMILAPSFGAIFVSDLLGDEDLEFVSRGDSPE